MSFDADIQVLLQQFANPLFWIAAAVGLAAGEMVLRVMRNRL